MPKLEPFTREGGQEWEEYGERLEQYFIATDVAEGRRRAVFLSGCGRPTNSLLRRLLAPDRPLEALLVNSLELLPVHYSTIFPVIVQQYHF